MHVTLPFTGRHIDPYYAIRKTGTRNLTYWNTQKSRRLRPSVRVRHLQRHHVPNVLLVHHLLRPQHKLRGTDIASTLSRRGSIGRSGSSRHSLISCFDIRRVCLRLRLCWIRGCSSTLSIRLCSLLSLVSSLSSSSSLRILLCLHRCSCFFAYSLPQTTDLHRSLRQWRLVMRLVPSVQVGMRNAWSVCVPSE